MAVFLGIAAITVVANIDSMGPTVKLVPKGWFSRAVVAVASVGALFQGC